jgi:hypothetical protein
LKPNASRDPDPSIGSLSKVGINSKLFIPFSY